MRVVNEGNGMTEMVRQSSRTRHVQVEPARKHRWLRWVAAGLATVVVLAFAGTFAFIHLGGPVPAPLALPKLNAAAAGKGSTPVDGTWTAGKGSLAGYRVREEFFGPGNSLVGRTSAVTGKVVIAHNDVTSASFRVDLTTVTASGKAQPQLAKIIDTASFPDATLTLTKPIVTGSGLVMNKTFRVKATGMLAMHGTTRPVTFQATARYSGSLLEAAGSIPVLFSDWNIHAPEFLQNHGLLEFLLVLRR
jgi:polyisoprenoid-binding protein YceI